MTEIFVEGWGILKWDYNVFRDFWRAATIIKTLKTAAYYFTTQGGALKSNLASDDIRLLSFLEKRGLLFKRIEGKREFYSPTEYGEFLFYEFDERFDALYKEMKELLLEFTTRLEEYSKKEVDK